jgi:hypothetical protein
MAVKYELREWAQSRSRMNCMTLFPSFCRLEDRHIFVSGTLRRAMEMVSQKCRRPILAALSLTDLPRLLRQGARAAGCVSIEVDAGTVVGLFERNGVGKTTCCSRLWHWAPRSKQWCSSGTPTFPGPPPRRSPFLRCQLTMSNTPCHFFLYARLLTR